MSESNLTSIDKPYKRAIHLYRVSTLGQVEKNDIPMQRQRCREFSLSQQWDIIDEYAELGVSGYKVSVNDRDAIQEIRRRAEAKEFDILLVFMFDRIGRRADETPFVVEWFIKNGIEVWSVEEGQQKLDSDSDYLINYIRYWTSSGESKKTSIRTRTRLEQIVLEGRYRGGPCPYGYNIIKSGRHNKKGAEIHQLVIDQFEELIVQQIFEWYADEGMGTFQIASMLNGMNIHSKSGRWCAKTIQYMLKNVAYRGILRSGKSCSEPFEHLRIIDDVLFRRVQDLMAERTEKNSLSRTAAMTNISKNLLSGNVFCGHCSGRIGKSTSGKQFVNSTGVSLYSKRQCYVCYTRKKGEMCEGAYTYTAKHIDEVVYTLILSILNGIPNGSYDDIKQAYRSNETHANKSRIKELSNNIAVENKRKIAIETEIIKCLSGESKLDYSLLSRLLSEQTSKIGLLQEAINSLKSNYVFYQKNDYSANIMNNISWSDLFIDCKVEKQKTIVSKLINKVIIYKEYNIKIYLNTNNF